MRGKKTRRPQNLKMLLKRALDICEIKRKGHKVRKGQQFERDSMDCESQNEVTKMQRDQQLNEALIASERKEATIQGGQGMSEGKDNSKKLGREVARWGRARMIRECEHMKVAGRFEEAAERDHKLSTMSHN